MVWITRGSTSAIPKAIENFKPSFDRLDALVLAQGAAIYRRGEFEMDGSSQGARGHLMSLMACTGSSTTCSARAKAR